jgi:2-haloacid dehalogenase
MIDYNHFAVLSFDCYGTLIDWETGILTALRPMLERHGVTTTKGQILEVYGELESQIESEGYRAYRSVLRQVVGRLGERFEFTPSLEDLNCLADSIGRWPAFPDTIDALHRLQTRYRLAIISNTDDDLFAETNKTLQVTFDHIVTAAQVGAYKPSHDMFSYAVQTIGEQQERILHVAQSIFHDHVPAKEMGFTTVWINRRTGQSGGGATPSAVARPDAEFPDLASLAAAMGL